MTRNEMRDGLRVIQGSGKKKTLDTEVDPYAHLHDRRAEDTYEAIDKRYARGKDIIPRGELSDFIRQRVQRGAQHLDSVRPGWAASCKRNQEIMEKMYRPQQSHTRREMVTIVDAILGIDDNARILNDIQNRRATNKDDTGPISTFFQKRCAELKIAAPYEFGIWPAIEIDNQKGYMDCLESLRAWWKVEIDKRVPPLKAV